MKVFYKMSFSWNITFILLFCKWILRRWIKWINWKMTIQVVYVCIPHSLYIEWKINWHTMPRHNKQLVSAYSCFFPVPELNSQKYKISSSINQKLTFYPFHSKSCTHPPISSPSSNNLFAPDLSLSSVGLPGGKFWRDSCCSFNWRRRFLLHNSWQSCHVGSSGGGILYKNTIKLLYFKI